MMEWMLSSSILILVVLLIRKLTLGRISMRLRYALWALVLVRLLVPFSFGSTPVSIMNTAQQVPVIQDAQLLHDIQHIEHVSGGAVEGYHQGDYMADFPTVIAEHKSEAEFSRMSTVLNVRDFLVPLWKIGVLVLLAVFLLSNLRFRAVLRKNRIRLETPDCPLPVYVTAAVETPCLFGLLRPAIYVTPEVQCDPKALLYALEHELTHFYQGDFLWSILRCVCLCLHWFNPLVWLAVKLSRQDAELSCDEGTIRRIGESHRIEYGNTLIDLTCAQRRPGDLLYAATTMTGSKQSIRERVTFIARKPRNLALAVVCVALTAATAVGCTFTGAAKPTANEPDAAPEPLTQEETPPAEANSLDAPAVDNGFTFADLDGLDFQYFSGASGWSTHFRIYPDGSFTGTYSDWDADSSGEHPNGVTRCNEFSGDLGAVEMVNDYTVRTAIKTLNYTHEIDTEELRDGILYQYTEAVGFEVDPMQVLLYFYLPNAPVKQLPEAFRNWTGLMYEGAENTTLDTYGAFNVTGEIGGLGYDPLPVAREQVKAILDAAETTYADLQDRLYNDGSLHQADMNGLAIQSAEVWDDALNQIWAVLKQVLPPAEMEALTTEELAWIKEKEAALQAAAEELDGGSLTPVVVGARAANLTRDRAYALAKCLGK